MTGPPSPALREDYRKYRPNIERVISQVASRGGRRLKLRYLGTARNNAWLKNRKTIPAGHLIHAAAPDAFTGLAMAFLRPG